MREKTQRPNPSVPKDFEVRMLLGEGHKARRQKAEDAQKGGEGKQNDKAPSHKTFIPCHERTPSPLRARGSKRA